VTADGDTWLGWARELHSIAQAGLTYAANEYDRQRYHRMRQIVAELTAALVDSPPEQVIAAVLSEQGYLTPKLDVRAAVHDDDGRVLMVREVADGGWTLPGGWADVDEGLVEGAVREVAEESGYLVAGVRLLGIYDKCRWGAPPNVFHTLTTLVGCRLLGGRATTSHETDGVDWFARDAVPPLSTSRTPAALLARVFEHHDDPTLPPDLV
jgi:ADP-ribose pyrophosphatase YjhB (NUDIX family)